MIAPVEVTMINHAGRTFRANITECQDGKGGTEYLYDPVMDALQYRVQIPGVQLSLITQDITRKELRNFLRTGKPIRIKQYGGN